MGVTVGRPQGQRGGGERCRSRGIQRERLSRDSILVWSRSLRADNHEWRAKRPDLIAGKTLLVRKSEVRTSGAEARENSGEAKDAARISGNILNERHGVAII